MINQLLVLGQKLKRYLKEKITIKAPVEKATGFSYLWRS